MLLELEEQFGMIDDIKAFTEIKQAEERDLILIVSQKNAVRNGNQCRFGGMAGAEAVLGVREEVVGDEIVVQLTLYNTLYDLGYHGDNGYWSEVGRIGGITGFVDRIDK